MPKLLFVLKHRDAPWGADKPHPHPHPYHDPYHLSSGLRNSVRFVVDMLHAVGIASKWVEVVDNNCIDREIKAYRPTHCIIEALWVVPEKFDVLKRLHPHVTFMVRNHSQMPFVANEGIAMGWFAEYVRRGVEISCNAPTAVSDTQALVNAFGHGGVVSYTPNFYPIHTHRFAPHNHPDNLVRVGCFGAVRPLKNHLTQAVAALRYADVLGKRLEFYINSSRVEGGGNPILKNLRELFAATPRAELKEVSWLDHHEFLDVMQTMDVHLQVSFSETFNITTSDAIQCSVPVVVSNQVSWLQPYAVANPVSSEDICNKMLAILRQDRRARLGWQRRDLLNYCRMSVATWYRRYGHGECPTLHWLV